MQPLIAVDGASGGQTVRNSVALSALAGKPIRVSNVCSSRDKPGLHAKDVQCIQLVADVCDAQVEGDRVGSTEFTFTPSLIQPGRYLVDTRSAMSLTVLAQTVLPCLLYATGQSSFHGLGGTDVSWSPPIDELLAVFSPMLARFGVDAQIALVRRGFFPEGGGEIAVSVNPVKGLPLKPLVLLQQGHVVRVDGRAFVTAGSRGAAELEQMVASAKAILAKSLPSIPINIQTTIEPAEDAVGHGSALTLIATTDSGCRFGATCFQDAEEPLPPQEAAKEVVGTLAAHVRDGGCVDEFIQDQVVIYMALAAGRSEVRIGPLTAHTKSAVRAAEALLPCRFSLKPDGAGSILCCEGAGLVAQGKYVSAAADSAGTTSKPHREPDYPDRQRSQDPRAEQRSTKGSGYEGAREREGFPESSRDPPLRNPFGTVAVASTQPKSFASGPFGAPPPGPPPPLERSLRRSPSPRRNTAYGRSPSPARRRGRSPSPRGLQNPFVRSTSSLSPKLAAEDVRGIRGEGSSMKPGAAASPFPFGSTPARRATSPPHRDRSPRDELNLRRPAATRDERKDIPSGSKEPSLSGFGTKVRPPITREDLDRQLDEHLGRGRGSERKQPLDSIDDRGRGYVGNRLGIQERESTRPSFGLRDRGREGDMPFGRGIDGLRNMPGLQDRLLERSQGPQVNSQRDIADIQRMLDLMVANGVLPYYDADLRSRLLALPRDDALDVLEDVARRDMSKIRNPIPYIMTIIRSRERGPVPRAASPPAARLAHEDRPSRGFERFGRDEGRAPERAPRLLHSGRDSPVRGTDPEIRRLLEMLVSLGRIPNADPRLCERLMSIPLDDAVDILEEVARRDMKNVNNPIGYIMGMIRSKQDGGYKRDREERDDSDDDIRNRPGNNRGFLRDTMYEDEDEDTDDDRDIKHRRASSPSEVFASTNPFGGSTTPFDNTGRPATSGSAFVF